MTIQVPMDVSRVEAAGDVVQVWGHVGDYEVCVYVSKLEARTMGLIVPPQEWRSKLTKEHHGEQ